MKKIVSFLLALTMLVSLFAMISCGDDNAGPKEEPLEDLVLVDGASSDYLILRAEKATKTVREAMTSLKKEIKEKLGADLEVKTDFVERNAENVTIPEREIIIGTADRPECEGVADEAPENGFVIKAVGKKLIICGKSDGMTAKGVEYFIENYVKTAEGRITVPGGFEKKATANYLYSASAGKTYAEMAKEVYKSFRKKFWVNKWVVGNNGFWDSAEMLETFIDAYEQTKDPEYLTLVEDYATSFSTKNTNWLGNAYNDDLMWITIAYLRIYRNTGTERYFKVAKSTYDAVYKRAWDGVLGGGLYWRTDNQTKNACVNCPAAIAANLIYEKTGDEKYIKQAKEIIDWVVGHLYESDGHVYDAMNIKGEVSKWASTYNQGTFIGACSLIYQNTGEEKYIGYADATATYTMKNMYNYRTIGTEDSGNDLPGFKGILTRWIYRYAVLRNNITVLEWLQLNADTAYSHKNNLGLIWTKWDAQTKDGVSGYNTFGFSTAVSLMFNCQQWWESEE